MSFLQLDLNPKIHKAIAACGYTEPTPIQKRSIPDILLGKDIVACAQTGTGKTAAFILPILHKLSLRQSQQTRVLILTPTRELASQITKAAGLYGKFLRFKIASLVGGMSYHHQIKDLMQGPDVIVATPGRLLDHIENKRLDLSGIETFVLDEADRMLDMGFIEDVERIAKLTPSHRQTLLFSATIDKQLQGIVNHLLTKPTYINLSNEAVSAPKITQEIYRAQSNQQKFPLLKSLIDSKNIYKSIIFSATKINADKLATQLQHAGFSAAALHGDLRQSVRNRTIEQLRRSKIQFLVATDVAARGIDISDITHVINFDLPRFCEDYVHRIGRTGRAGKLGVAISFVTPTDTRHLQRIERFIGQKIKVIHHAENSKYESVDPDQNKPSQNGYARDFGQAQERGSRSKYSDRKRPNGFDSSDSNRREKRSTAYAERDDNQRSRFSDDSDGARQRRRPGFGKSSRHASTTESSRERFGRRSESDKENTGKRADGGRERFGRRSESDKEYAGKRADSGRERFGRRSESDKENTGKRADGGRERFGRRSDGDKESFGKRAEGGKDRFGRSKESYSKRSDGTRSFIKTAKTSSRAEKSPTVARDGEQISYRKSKKKIASGGKSFNRDGLAGGGVRKKKTSRKSTKY